MKVLDSTDERRIRFGVPGQEQGDHRLPAERLVMKERDTAFEGAWCSKPKQPRGDGDEPTVFGLGERAQAMSKPLNVVTRGRLEHQELGRGAEHPEVRCSVEHVEEGQNGAWLVAQRAVPDERSEVCLEPGLEERRGRVEALELSRGVSRYQFGRAGLGSNHPG